MKYTEILLSNGSFPWLALDKIILLAQITGYDGIELLPTRKAVTEFKKLNDNSFLKYIKNIHQNWRLDIGLDNSYGIRFPTAILFTILRYMLFPNINKSNNTIKLLSEKLNLPVTVHGLSDKWTKDNGGREFQGGISYEIIGISANPKELRDWTRQKCHNIVIDSRDDQSLIWAKTYEFGTWEMFWKWLGIRKIKGYQLTFIGIGGLKKIMNHKKSLPEEQLLWLYKNKWAGHVTVEVNPLVLFFLFKGNIKKGLATISKFVKQTLIKGKKWSA